MNEQPSATSDGPITIGVDARTFQYSDSTSRGIGHYALHHLLASASLRPNWRFILFNDKGEANSTLARLLKLPNLSLQPYDFAPTPRIDLFHITDPMNTAPGFDSPMRLFPGVKASAIFYDLTPLRFYWNSWPAATQQAYTLRLEQLRHRKTNVLAISEFTRLDLVKGGGIPAERVTTITAGLNRAEAKEGADPALFQAVKRQYGISKQFFLHVGALDPHKNFETVIQAFGRVASRTPAQLVVVGQKEHYLKQIADYCAQQKMKDVIFTGFIPRAELEALYSEAVALLFLSRYEGFGFPVLEAMAQGCPVITTNVTSLPEVAGDAAMTFSPDDTPGIADGMQKLLVNITKREEFRRKGATQAAQFTWEKTGRKTIAVWERMLGISASAAGEAIPASVEKSPEVEVGRAVPCAPAINQNGGLRTARPASSVETPTSGTELPSFNHELVWLAPWQNPSGYCSEGLAFAQGIAGRVPLEMVDAAKTKSAAFVEGLPVHLRKLLKERLKEQVNVGNKVAILHMPGGSFSYLPGAAWCVGRTMFETDRIPASWVTRCNLMDEIWVPSQLNLETFAACGVERDKLVVMPGSVDEKEFDPARHKPLPLPDRAKFNFLSMFEWSSRKGWDVLLSAYFHEFSAEDDVCLYLRTYLVNQPDGDSTSVIERLIREHTEKLGLGSKRLPRIKILSQQIPQAELPRLYKAVDCLVAPSRGEGWGRPQHEAMLMELPVIGTNWSGNTEFMNSDNSYLLDFELVEAKYLEADLWHYRGHRWANPSEKHLRELMRCVVTNREEAIGKGKAARRHMVENFSIATVADKVMARLREIEAKISNPVRAAGRTRSKNFTKTTSHTKPVQVAWEGSFLDFGSLSHVNRELTRQLSRQSEIKLTCVGKNVLSPGLANVPALTDMARRLQPQPARQTQVTVRHAWPPNWEAPASGAWVLIQPWEYGALPAEWVRQLGRVDEVWVPSEYVRRIYVDSGVEPAKVKVVPNGVDVNKFNMSAAPLNLATRKSFKFLFVGGTIHRKGPDLLLETYLKQFTAVDDVCLVIKDFGGKSVYAGQTLESRIKAAQAQPDAPEILYLTDELSPEALPGLYRACDCLVHPYRGEGFGLPVLEAMACSLPVIVTGGGSTDDFAGDDHAYRIPARRQSIGPEVSGMKLARDGWLLEPDPTALAEKMKWVAEHRDEARAKGRAAAEYVAREWTWERAAQIAAERLYGLGERKEAEKTALAERRARKSAPIVLPETARIGQLHEARELLNRKEFRSAWNATLAAMTLRPFHCEAWLLLAEIAQSAGDFGRARACAERAKQMAPNWKPAKQFLNAIPSKPGQSVAWPSLPEVPPSPRLSVCLITKNEEQFLEKCLQSVRELAHQIIVVDTGSSDKTIEIAKKVNADIYSFAWNDDFSAARNESLKYATGDWILVLDADEELLPEHRETILKEMQCGAVLAYRLPIIDEGREAEGCSYVPRLFRNAPGLFFVGRVHEQIFSSLEVRRADWGMENHLGKSALFHHGYTKEVTTSRNKVARNLRLLERAIEELPNEPNLLMSFGLELVRSGQLDAGLEQYWDAFHAMSVLPADEIVPELRETLLTQLATHLLAAKRFSEIVKVAQSPLAKSAAATASQHFILGLAHMELKEPAEATEQMRQCLAKRNRPALSPVNPEISKAGPNHCLALCLSVLKQHDAADKAFVAALVDDPKSRPAKFDFARLKFERGDGVAALQLLHELVAEDPKDAKAWLLGGQIALSRPEYLDFARDWTGESVKQFSGNSAVNLQRAEALLLSGEAAAALPLWTQNHSPSAARHLAAIVLCENIAGDCHRRFASGDEPLVSQEFLKWYRALIAARSSSTVERLNQGMERLRVVLPSFVKMWETAVKEAQQAVSA